MLLGVLLNNEVCLATIYFSLLFGSFSKLSELIFELALVDWVFSELSRRLRWLLLSVMKSEFSLPCS